MKDDEGELSLLQEVIASLPPSRFAFAYGSGALPQRVDSAEQWHLENMNSHGNMCHYSSLMKLLGPRAVASVQQCALGARIYYNTLVPWRNGRTFKYGVITFADLLDDLREWKTLYVSGRLQKPVRILKEDKSIEVANEKNIESAACAALLSLPERFDETRFYETVASLSYVGDVRMKFAEDPNKVSRIVSGNRDGFRKLYGPTMQRLRRYVHWDSSGKAAIQDMKAEAREKLLTKLPKSFVGRMKRFVGDDEIHSGGKSGLLGAGRLSIERSIARAVVGRGEEHYRRALQMALGRTVWQSSSVQTLKGVLTAGMLRSTTYALSKLQKAKL